MLVLLDNVFHILRLAWTFSPITPPWSQITIVSKKLLPRVNSKLIPPSLKASGEDRFSFWKMPQIKHFVEEFNQYRPFCGFEEDYHSKCLKRISRILSVASGTTKAMRYIKIGCTISPHHMSIVGVNYTDDVACIIRSVYLISVM